MRNILPCLFAAVILSACEKETPAPTACITVDVTETVDSTHVFSFSSDCSMHDDRRVWDFGDGYTSADVAPTHTYQYFGSYNVTLTVYNAAEKSSTVSKTITMGHYTLDKTEVKETAVPIPMRYTLLDDNFQDVGSAYVTSASQLPGIYNVPDGPYDVTGAPLTFNYEERTATGSPVWNVNFSVTYAAVHTSSNHSLTFNLPHGSDTAVVVLYYKIAPH